MRSSIRSKKLFEKGVERGFLRGGPLKLPLFRQPLRNCLKGCGKRILEGAAPQTPSFRQPLRNCLKRAWKEDSCGAAPSNSPFSKEQVDEHGSVS
jgi:hypothetical protein